MKHSVLLVGLGNIGVGYDIHVDLSQRIYSHARAFSLHEKFTLLGGVDLDKNCRQRFEKRYQCPTYLTIKDALRVHQPDVVVLSLPTLLHGEALLCVLEQSRPKLLLCEKPISYNLEEAALMVEACCNQGVQLYVNYMRRSDPGVIEVKRRFDKGDIKSPIKGVVWYSKGFIHNGSHFINLLEYWLGAFQGSVMLNRGRSLNGIDEEPDVMVSFEKGSVCFLAAWEEAFTHYTIELISPCGRLRYEQEGALIQWENIHVDPFFQGYTTLSHQKETIESGMECYQWHVVEQLALALGGQDACLCTGSEALQTLKTINQILS